MFCLQLQMLPGASFDLGRAVFKHMNWFLTVYLGLALVNCACTLVRPCKLFMLRPPSQPGTFKPHISNDLALRQWRHRCVRSPSPLRGS